MEGMAVWTSIYVANNKTQADRMCSALKSEGIMTDVRTIGSMEHGKSGIFEIRVLESEVEEAQNIVCCGMQGT